MLKIILTFLSVIGGGLGCFFVLMTILTGGLNQNFLGFLVVPILLAGLALWLIWR